MISELVGNYVDELWITPVVYHPQIIDFFRVLGAAKMNLRSSTRSLEQVHDRLRICLACLVVLLATHTYEHACTL